MSREEAVLERALGLASAPADRDTIEQAEAELARIDRLQDAALDQLARGVISQATADRQVERLGRERRAAASTLRDAQAAAIGLRPAVERREVVEAVRLMRADAEHMTREQRRELLRASVGRIAVSADEIDLDLLIDTGHVAPGEHACRSDLARHRIPAGRLTVATPLNRRRRRAA